MAAVLPSAEGTGPEPHDVTDAERVLHKVAKRVGMTEAGEEWIIASTDPYHDHTMMIQGYPDADSRVSQVQVIKRKVTISTPAAAAGGTWDLHVAFLPIVASAQVVSAVYTPSTGQYTASSVAPSNPIAGTVTCVAVPSGLRTFPEQGGGVDFTQAEVHELSIVNTDQVTASVTWGAALDAFADGPTRVIGAAFEVTNTTAAILASGSATIYGMVQKSATNFCTGAGTNVGMYEMHHAPPATDDEAYLTPDALQWRAAEGAYVVARQQGEENPFVTGTNVLQTINARDAKLGAQVPIHSWQFCNAVPVGTAPTGFSRLPQSSAMSNFVGGGCYLSGLADGAVITVTARFITETAANSDRSDMMVVSRRSPPPDKAAFEVAARILLNMPPGTKKDNNFLGKWFSGAISTIGRAVLPALTNVANDALDNLAPKRHQPAAPPPVVVRERAPRVIIEEKSRPGRAPPKEKKKGGRGAGARRRGKG